MEWLEWKGKKIFLRTKHGKVYSGKVIDIEVGSPLIWIIIIDKFGKRVQFSSTEIIEIKEEREWDLPTNT